MTLEDRELFEKKQNQITNEGIIIREVPLESSGLPIEEWEVKRINDLSKEKGVNVKIKPLYSIFDVTNQVSLVYRWILEGKDCPFLKDNQCLIYNERPLRCRTYPLAVYFQDEQLRLDYLICQAKKDKTGILSTTEILRMYGDIFRYSINSLQIKEYKETKLKFLINNGMINPAFKQPLKDLLKEIQNNPHIGMFEFMIAKGLVTLEKHNEDINQIENHNIKNNV
jgi:Fe-S-cluster containining protein